MNTSTKICKRCNGTGKHSYHPIHGSVCFACGGRTNGRKGRFAVVIFHPAREGRPAVDVWSVAKLFPSDRHARAFASQYAFARIEMV